MQAIYKTGIREVYYHKVKKRRKRKVKFSFIVSPEKAAIKQEIPIYKEYKDGPLDDSTTYHWCINRTQFNESTLLEKRISMHRLLHEIIATKPEPDWYPIDILEHDFELLKSRKYNKFISSGAITCFPGHPLKHYRILEHFFNPGANYDERLLWKSLQHICNKQHVRINSSNVRRAARWYIRRQIISPLVYCALFKSMKIKGPIADLHPGYGSKALACAMMDIEYYPIKTESFQYALDIGFGSFTRSEFNWFDGQNIELLISDNNFTQFDMPDSNLLKNARRMLCYVSRSDRKKIVDKYKPSIILQLYNNAVEARTLQSSNYLLVW